MVRVGVGVVDGALSIQTCIFSIYGLLILFLEIMMFAVLVLLEVL